MGWSWAAGESKSSERGNEDEKKDARLTNLPPGSRSRSPQPNTAGRGPQAQAEGTNHPLPPNASKWRCADFALSLDARSRPPILLHGRQVPRLLHHHDRLLARPNRRRLRGLLTGALPTYRWQGAVDGGMLVQEKVDGCGTNRNDMVEWR